VSWKKIGQFGALFYLIIYLAAVLTPRVLPKFQVIHQTLQNEDLSLNSAFDRVLIHILYAGGNLEPVVNFLILIPFFAFLLLVLGSSKAPIVLSVCLSLSATAEILQRFIPGRVSSLQDLLLNCLGAVSAFLLYKIALKANFLK
jgi:glycopeptide antibiotics resistance protein